MLWIKFNNKMTLVAGSREVNEYHGDGDGRWEARCCCLIETKKKSKKLRRKLRRKAKNSEEKQKTKKKSKKLRRMLRCFRNSEEN